MMNEVVTSRNMARFHELLKDHGGYYTVEDVFDHLERGTMQSFAIHDTWVITQINVYPRKKVLTIVAVIGDLPDLAAIEARLVEFAREHNCVKISTETNGRPGWDRVLLDGWQKTAVVYEKDVRHG